MPLSPFAAQLVSGIPLADLSEKQERDLEQLVRDHTAEGVCAQDIYAAAKRLLFAGNNSTTGG